MGKKITEFGKNTELKKKCDFDGGKNTENRVKMNKNKAKTNKTQLCMCQKYGSNLFAVFTRASVVMFLQIIIAMS